MKDIRNKILLFIMIFVLWNHTVYSSDIILKYSVPKTDQSLSSLEESGEAAAGRYGDRDLYAISSCSESNDWTEDQVCYADIFQNSYGDQLSFAGRDLYQQLIRAWGNGGTGEFYWNFPEKVSFTAKGEIQNNVWTWDKNHDTGYQAAADVVRKYMQSAYDAYAYDYPEVFWLKSLNFAFITSFAQNVDGTVTGYISQVRIVGAEKWGGAKREIADFQNSVNAACQEIRSSFPVNATYGEKIKVIHDWICNKVRYSDNIYGHTANGVFIHRNEVVCEGYSKGFKVLCNRFDIPCVCVSGDAYMAGRTEPHMWNCVKVKGKWYLADLTWDDMYSGYTDMYLLTGLKERGRYGTVASERKNYTRLSASQYTIEFVTPILDEVKYHEWKANGRIESSCKESGIQEFICMICGQESRKDLPLQPHEWCSWKIENRPSCNAEGKEVRECMKCGNKEERSISKTTQHGKIDWKIARKPTCLEEGIEQGYCSVCGNIVEKRTIPKDKNHSFTDWIIVLKPSCGNFGTKYRVCSICEEKETKTILPTGNHTAGSWIVDNKASCNAYGSKIKKCTGCGKILQKQAIPKIAHQYSEWKIIQSATIYITGRKQRSCSVCGNREEAFIAKLLPKVSLNITEISLTVGKTKQLKATMAAGDAVVSWKTSNKKIVTISSTGKLTAKTAGTASITVTLKSGITASCKVKVYAIPANKIMINATGLKGTELKIRRGKSVNLNVTPKPENTTDTVSYSSSDTQIFAVLSSGKITAKKTGTATLTIRVGKLIKKISVKVTL